MILSRLTPGLWACSVDLRDAYLHVPVRPDHSQFLSFRYDGSSYRFTVLPFGLSTAPRTFTRLVRAVAAFLRRLGVQIFVYLDDWLVVAPSREVLLADTQRVLDVAASLGWLVNREKSSLTPAQRVTYLGSEIDLLHGRAYPTAERVEAVVRGLAVLLRPHPQPARAWLVLLGYLASLVDLVPWCRLYMRPLQFHLLAFFRPTSRDLSVPIPPAPHLARIFRWWCTKSNLRKGVSFPPQAPSFTLTTDASLGGWGAHAPGVSLAHVWEEELQGTHINVLELLAVFRALVLLERTVGGRMVLVRCDNTSAVSYINRQGGTRSLALWSVTWDLFQWCEAHQVSLRAIHLPGCRNSIADALSRLSGAPTEWSLDAQVTSAVFEAFGAPEVDLFASHLNHKLPRFVSRVPCPQSWAVDAFALDWSHLQGYAFPPFALVGRVVEKARAAGCRLTLIAPFWPSQLWFRPLLELLAEVPRILPPIPALLSLPGRNKTHDHPGALHLTAWSLSGCPSERRVFRRRLPRWRPRVGDVPPFACMIRDSGCSENGVMVARFLRARPLSGKWATS